MRKKIKLKNADFFVSRKGVNPLKQVSGTFYISRMYSEDGKYEVSKSPISNIFPFLDKKKGYINACDIDGISKGTIK